MILARLGSWVMLLLGIPLMFTEVPILSIIGLLICIGGIVVRLVFYRCPHCHRPFPWRTPLAMEYCPYCGEFIG